MAATFLRPAAEGEGAETAGSSGRAAAAGSSRTSRAFKLGNMQLKKLKNGDVYRVSRGHHRDVKHVCVCGEAVSPSQGTEFTEVFRLGQG